MTEKVMAKQRLTNTVTPGPTKNTVRTAKGKVVTVPAGWILLRPGDAALTRRVKAAGAHWVVAEKKGSRVVSRGVWTAAATIDRLRTKLEAERSTEGFAKQRTAAALRREKAQAKYVEDFHAAVVEFLRFHKNHAQLAERLASAVTSQATPVGSGTVARTERIPIQQRAKVAVLAWMRHNTTTYDSLVIPRVRGQRRDVRRKLAGQSNKLLERYRSARSAPQECPLTKALLGDT